MLLWLFLIGIVSESLGRIVGLPYLFLEPEYVNEVNFVSFFILGVCLGIFTMCYHITCFLLDAPRFRFVACLPTPFIKFIINNSTVPAVFIVIYTYKVIDYQIIDNEWHEVVLRILGLIIGFNLSALFLMAYFISTNRDIFKLLATKIDKRLKRTKTLKVNVLANLKGDKQEYLRVDYYLNNWLRVEKNNQNYLIDKALMLRIFKQNHINAVIIQTFLFFTILLLGGLSEYTYFQLPAAASLVLLLTLILIVSGAFYFWLKGWAVSVAILLLLFFNYAFTNHWIVSTYQAFGLNYNIQKADYQIYNLKKITQDSICQHDKKQMLQVLENWKRKCQRDSLHKPTLIFLNVTGGGQRSAMWTFRTLQYLDSLWKGKFFRHTVLITGASGGMVGAAYFRELYLQAQTNPNIRPWEYKYWENLGKDNLNAVAFNLIINDLFLGFDTFNYSGYAYRKDRGYAFEEQLNKNTEFVLDKPLHSYRQPEMLAQIPMQLLAPTILNDGRRLYISPLNFSFMTLPEPKFTNHKIHGVEFLRLFEAQNAPNLRFLTALRMNATFPYVTPNVSLPTIPTMEIMDAGLSDNYGVGDAVKFLHIFKDWIEKNTSRVVFVAIRDTRKKAAITATIGESLLARIFAPLGSLYTNWENIQDMNNDKLIEYAQYWLKIPIERIDLQYIVKGRKINTKHYEKRASLSWRLTEREKESIFRSIYLPENQEAIRQLAKLLSR
ncbi:MAG: patatin-like phospholipase family protein [Microscillaceae bacterium]|nr:patatin-like phospholipase family protein [Microscillaceae bacterium]MDW8460788.1 patatin-like phospholipase family protein [Cytophagales bacterium]